MRTPFEHPARLRALAVQHGAALPTLAPFRYLELACGLGGELLPLAARFPESTFVGSTDAEFLATARADASRCGLANLTFTTEAELEGRFDFVIANDVYATLSRSEQGRLLGRIARHLAPDGVAAIAYPTLPGASFRRFVRETLARPSRAEMSAHEQLACVKGRLSDLARHLPEGSSAHVELLRDELERAFVEATTRPAALFSLGGEALHVADVLLAARRQGLEFLCDAAPATGEGELETSFVPLLVADGLPRLEAEEILDLVSERPARASLFVHAGRPISGEAVVAPLCAAGYFAGSFTVLEAEPELARGVVQSFATRPGPVIATDEPALKAALLSLADAWPEGLREPQLRATLAERLGRDGVAVTDADVDATRLDLEELVRRRQLEVLPWTPSSPEPLGDRPRLHPWARIELERGMPLTSVRHEPVELDPAVAAVALLLDGTQSLAACAAALGAAIAAGTLTIDALPSAPEVRTNVLHDVVASLAEKLRRLGLLEDRR
ncbi:MAG: class I SAM-dependent methyltransferase [Deltaproteobacteria bacterium]|nr:class I SAM-dependent methyltransferase [Deltaproteobacteria bacterium]